MDAGCPRLGASSCEQPTTAGTGPGGFLTNTGSLSQLARNRASSTTMELTEEKSQGMAAVPSDGGIKQLLALGKSMVSRTSHG